MSSPAKKRKLNSGSKASSSSLPSRGLEYFFAKQRQNAPPGTTDSSPAAAALGGATETSAVTTAQEITDEELARKLQAEWNREAFSPESDPVASAGELGAAPDLTANPEVNPQVASPGGVNQTSENLKEGMNTLSLRSAIATEDTATASLALDESALAFEPAKYIPALQAQWRAEGGSASYALLTRCFVLVNQTGSRIKIMDTLVNCLRILIEADPESLLPAVWLATNAISPPYISLELGLGGSALSKTLKNVCGLSDRGLKSLYNKFGDPGDVAFEAKKKQTFTLRKPQPLTIVGVFNSLVQVARTQGQGSVDAKQRIVDKLLRDARGGEESRYIVRTLCQNLRIGAVTTTLLNALARAFLLSPPAGSAFATRNQKELLRLKKDELADLIAKSEEIVKACYAVRPNYNDIVPVMLEIGVAEELLARCAITLHTPIRPMLGNITRDPEEMLEKLQRRDFACEFKYDGQRAQVHCDEEGRVSVFSRNLELMTDKYPDLVALVPKIKGPDVTSFIMEGEVVAMDTQTGEMKNFQTLTTRARKDVALGSITVGVCLFAFDLMYLNGRPLLARSFRERRALLRSSFAEVPQHFTWVKSLDATSNEEEAVMDFFASAIEHKCEGIMVKILDNLPDLLYDGDAAQELQISTKLTVPNAKSKAKGKGKADKDGAEKRSSRRKPLLATYEPDKRLDSWLKFKKDYDSNADTLDLVPIAAWHGNGRKAKWWSPILMAVRNEETGSLEAVTKCMSGFKDAFYKANKEFYNNGEDGEAKNTRGRRPAFVEYSGPEPDVWFEPQEVWEMAFADITLSSTYTAAIGLASDVRGLSLRFPRFLKTREDKGIGEASSSEFLAGLYRLQEAKPKTPGPSKGAVEG